MLSKIENPLGLSLKGVEILIEQLQQQFNQFVEDPIHENLGLSLEESGVAIEIKTKNQKYSYNLEQLKLLKVEMSAQGGTDFKPGQKVVYIDIFMPDTVETITSIVDGWVSFNNGTRGCIAAMIRPATEQEVKANKRRKVM